MLGLYYNTRYEAQASARSPEGSRREKWRRRKADALPGTAIAKASANCWSYFSYSGSAEAKSTACLNMPRLPCITYAG
eukprot:3942843-Amphidinium_carterae.1